MKIWSKIKSHISLKLALGLIIGAIGGYAYYHFIGCNTGSCPITSNPWSSIFYGILVGGVLTYQKPQKVNAGE
jgi:C4-dicarboxylate transporter